MSIPAQAFVTLNTGARMPAIGLGCVSGITEEEHDAAQPWIESALKTGYRHLDTAHAYGTERAVGRAVRASGIPREEIFVVTKLPWHHHATVTESLRQSLSNAELDYYDLWLLHWPQAFVNIDGKPTPRHPGPNGEPDGGTYILDDSVSFNETWAEMEKLYKAGKVRAIGVSNFSVKNLTKLLETATVVPAVNQVECHPHQAQPALLRFCAEKGIILTAYAATGYAAVAADPTVGAIAKKHGVSPTQVSLAWQLARGTTAVPKSTNAERQRTNLLELPTLTTQDVALLDTLHEDAHYCVYPEPRELNGQKLVWGWTYEQLGW